MHLNQINNKLTICSFNCRSVKSSVDEIVELCSLSHIVCLQEHWLLPHELSLLSNISTNFFATGTSAMTLDNDVIVGRPYGGTGILYHKSLSSLITVVDTGHPRLTAVIVAHSACGPILVVSAYLPTDYGDSDSLEDYVATCACISALYNDCDAVQLIVAGDFNCQVGSRFFNILKDFVDDNNLKLTDINRLNDVFTYCNDAGTATSWIDHVACSSTVDSMVSSCDIRYDFVSSDHKPLFVSFDNIGANINLVSNNTPVQPDTCRYLYDWSRCDSAIVSDYQTELDCCLNEIKIPISLFGSSVTTAGCNTVIDEYYDNVVKCINAACKRCIPGKLSTGSSCDYVVPGWNDYVKEKHDLARNAFLEWKFWGKPHQGPYHHWMKTTRARFKLALRYCKQHEDMLRADALANSLSYKQHDKFWKLVNKFNNSKATKFVQVIDGCTGEEAIAERWRAHYEQLYNSINDHESKRQFNTRLSQLLVDGADDVKFTVHDVASACKQQKMGKAVGADNVAMEALIYGSVKLYVHISLLFSLCITYGHVPDSLTQSFMVPLVKNKAGNLSDINNYRAIAISPALSKLFECLLEKYIRSYGTPDDCQFGFKSGLSTSTCTNVLKQTVDYFTDRGSHVFACFVDIGKCAVIVSSVQNSTQCTHS